MDDAQDNRPAADGGVRPPAGAASAPVPDSASRILESITDAFFALDAEWRFTYVNDHADRLMSRGRAEVMGRVFWDVFPRLLGSVFEREYRRAVAENIPVSFEEYYTPLDAWLEVRACPAPEGGLSVFFQNVTVRRQDEEARREGERRFRALADNITQLAWMADREGSVFWYNQRWFDYTGTTLEQMIGWEWRAVHHPDHVERVTEEFRAHMRAGRVWEDTFPLRGRDGTYRWFLSRAAPVRDDHGNVVLWCGTNTDVTELREAEAALRESEHLRRAALAGAPLVLWAMDAQGVITLAEGSGLALAGQTKENYVGRSVFAQSEDEALRAAWRRALAGEEAAYDTANGGILFHNELRPQRGAGGAVTGVIGVAFDVTERAAAEEALRDSAERQKALLRDMLASVTGDRLRLVEAEDELPAPLSQGGEPIPLTRESGLRALRERVGEAAGGLCFPAERCYDIVTAASEGGMNAVTHGGGLGEAAVSFDGAGTVQVRVRDWGAGISPQDLPRAALSRGWSSAASLGHGLAMMLQSVDRLWLQTGPGGTTVVLEQDREEPPPAWL